MIGISFEISGATLIAGEVLFASDIDVFARGKSFYGESPSKEAGPSRSTDAVGGPPLVRLSDYLKTPWPPIGRPATLLEEPW